MRLMPRASSLWVLGSALMLFVITWPFLKLFGMIFTTQQWLTRLRQERLAPSPAGVWLYVDQTSRCIGCGLCDAVADPEESPSQWIIGSVRMPENATLALQQAERLRQLAPAIERMCPANVKVTAVVQLIEDNAKMLA
jgi:hypothetical protein